MPYTFPEYDFCSYGFMAEWFPKRIFGANLLMHERARNKFTIGSRVLTSASVLQG